MSQSQPLPLKVKIFSYHDYQRVGTLTCITASCGCLPILQVKIHVEWCYCFKKIGFLETLLYPMNVSEFHRGGSTNN